MPNRCAVTVKWCISMGNTDWMKTRQRWCPLRISEVYHNENSYVGDTSKRPDYRDALCPV